MKAQKGKTKEHLNISIRKHYGLLVLYENYETALSVFRSRHVRDVKALNTKFQIKTEKK